MAKIPCPRCRADATRLSAIVLLHRVAYCEHCGWNLNVAATQVQTDVRANWIVSGFGLVLVLLVWRGPGGFGGALGIGVAFLVLPASLALSGQYRFSQIKRVTTALAKSASPTATVDGAQTQSNFELDRFRTIARPRHVRMIWRGHLYVVGVAGATALAVWLLSVMVQGLLHPPPGTALKAAFAAVIYGWWCWSCFAFFRNRLQERNLFRNGELAHGTVATRTEWRYGTHIVYTFQAVSGRTFQKRVFDFSNDQFEQMPVHVFYDALDPSRNAALETSLYRVD